MTYRLNVKTACHKKLIEFIKTELFFAASCSMTVHFYDVNSSYKYTCILFYSIALHLDAFEWKNASYAKDSETRHRSLIIAIKHVLNIPNLQSGP